MAISFTGSSATGSAIIANTSERVGATFLELGGKSALVVFDDVDTDAAVKTVMNGLLTNGGQICTAHSRLIVHKNMAPKLLPGRFSPSFSVIFNRTCRNCPYSRAF